MAESKSLPDIGMSDPNHMQAPNQSAGGKTKISPTDMSGVSGQPTGASYVESLASQKAGGKIGVGTEVQGTTLPIASGSEAEKNYANTGANTLYDENNSAPTSV